MGCCFSAGKQRKVNPSNVDKKIEKVSVNGIAAPSQPMGTFRRPEVTHIKGDSSKQNVLENSNSQIIFKPTDETKKPKVPLLGSVEGSTLLQNRSSAEKQAAKNPDGSILKKENVYPSQKSSKKLTLKVFEVEKASARITHLENAKLVPD